MDFEWSREDRYRSNGGRGPLTARILCATNKTVTMERWADGAKHVTRFELPIKFLSSPTCGWRKGVEAFGFATPAGHKPRDLGCGEGRRR